MNKTLAETIYKRKSVRVFSEKPVEILENDIDLIKEFNIQPLLDSIRVKVKVLKKKEVKNNRSEYCIAFYSEEKPLHLENIGFIGQQIDLELQSRGLGTCWWGMKKPKKEFKSVDGLDCMITMTVGYPKITETRIYPDGFKRKTLKDIIINDTPADIRLIEAVRVAPSAVNLQPWLIEIINNKYNFYLKTPKGFIEKMIKDMRQIDIGIAMAHLTVQAKADGLQVSFSFEGKDVKQGKFIASVVTSA
jgi:nitroreductase